MMDQQNTFKNEILAELAKKYTNGEFLKASCKDTYFLVKHGCEAKKVTEA